MLMYIVSFITSQKLTNLHFAVFVPSQLLQILDGM